MPSPLRPLLNALFAPPWTAVMVTGAVGAAGITGDGDLFRRMERVWAKGLTRVWGVDVEVFGAENIDPAQSCVIMSNHASHVDIVALFLALPVVPGFLAKSELDKVPFLSAALRAGGHVVIDRGKHASAVETLKAAADEVRGGKTIAVFPEGTRGDSATVGKFKKGGFHVAKAACVPIVPVGVRGSRDVLPKHGRLLMPGRVEVHIGKPISAADVVATPIDELVARTRAEVIALSAMPARESVQG